MASELIGSFAAIAFAVGVSSNSASSETPPISNRMRMEHSL
jgi:hypothetical protein